MSSTFEQATTVEAAMLSLTVRNKTEIAHEIFLFELVSDTQPHLPAFSAGSHVVVVTPAGLTRRYSLCNAASEDGRYVIAVKRDAQGDGGSVSMADRVQVGDRLLVSRPENYFPLASNLSSCVLIAGGIGVTPILCMVHELLARKIDFRVIYCTRSPETTAFLKELSAPELAGRVLIHHDHGDRALSLDLAPLLAERASGAQLYCCGPRPLMQAVRDMTRHWPSSVVHFEDFGTSPHPAHEHGPDQPFSVRLARQNLTVNVPVGVSILEALRGSGVSVPSSCESGTCGSCRTGLIAGVAEHRDFVLDDDEHGKDIMICVSRAQSAELVLDI